MQHELSCCRYQLQRLSDFWLRGRVLRLSRRLSNLYPSRSLRTPCSPSMTPRACR